VLVTNLNTLSYITLQYTLTTTFAIDSHHPFVAFLSVKKLCYHDTVLFSLVILKWIPSTNLTTMNITIYIRQ